MVRESCGPREQDGDATVENPKMHLPVAYRANVKETCIRQETRACLT